MGCIHVFLSHSEVDCWNFSEVHRSRLERELPGERIRVSATVDEFVMGLSDTETAVVWSFRQEWFEPAAKLRRIVTPAAGRDYFKVIPPAGLKIVYSSFHGRLIAETVLAMMLAENRGIIRGTELQSEGSLWPKHELSLSMRLLYGTTALILGFGHIGREIGRLLKPFGVRILGIRRTIGEVPEYFTDEDRVMGAEDLYCVLPHADHLILALPSDTGTDRIVDGKALSLLPSHAAVYNIGRGNAIDEEALASALSSGRIRAAYLDVFREEPLKEDSPLRSCPTCRIFPHSSAIAPQYLDFFLDEFIPRYRGWQG